MFKRANKVTALLVAAASIMSVVPAMADDATSRLGNKTGTIKEGIAFDGGAYSYFGYRTDDDDTGVYYNNDGGTTKEKLDPDLEDYRFNLDSKYGTKYAYAKENSNDDEYLVDLSTGKIVDDTSVEEKTDNAKSKLVSKLKKADRYEDVLDNSDNMLTNFDSKYSSSDAKFKQILPGQFGEVWYKYSVTTGTAVNIGFTNDSGSYIDLSQETNIRVYSSKTKRAEYIKEFNDENKDAALKIELVDAEAIAQDSDYIYTLTQIKVTDTNVTPNTTRTEYYIQKISKAQGSKDDGEAYTAKSIDSYLLQAPSATIRYDEGDFDNAYNRLFGLTPDYTAERMLGVVVKDGNLYLYTAKLKTGLTETDKLQVAKLKLGKFKKDVKDADGNLKASDVDVNAVKKDGDTDDGDIVDFDLESPSSDDVGLIGLQKVSDYSKYGDIKIATRDVYRMPSVSIDTKGTVWAIEKGKIIKYSGTDKSTVYTLDRSVNAIDAYDENNIIAWDTTGDVYTTITEGKKQTENDGVTVNPDLNKDKFANGFGTDGKFYENGTAAVSKWVSDAGKWYFLDATGAKKTGWAQDGSAWYLLGTDGVMLTGWQTIGGTWYYLNPINTNGKMLTGWFQDTTGTWYYADANGAMLYNTVVDGYKLGANGAWVQ